MRCGITGDIIEAGDVIRYNYHTYTYIGFDAGRLVIDDNGVIRTDDTSDGTWANLPWYIVSKGTRYYPFTSNLP